MFTKDQIEKNAKEQYGKTTATGKRVLESTFGKDFFIIPLTERIKTFTDLCIMAEIYDKDSMKKYIIHNKDTYKQKADKYLERLMLFETVFNAGVLVDMANTDQRKYYPYHKIIVDKSDPAGFRLSFFVCRYDDAAAFLGARPYFLNSAHAQFVGTHFIAEYEGWAQNFQLSKTNP